jgi:tRNA pseudouridine55 synthase
MAAARSEGLLLVDKPAGMTSHDAVNRARRALGERRIGHAGTLDPFATGLLVLLVGRATRLLPYVEGEPKVYEATIRFGTETDTDDLTGNESARAAAPSLEKVESAIAQLTGEFEQVPPAFSAKQVGGRRAYSAARRGDTMVLAPVSVRVHDWTLIQWRGEVMDVVVTCGGGTYVRALARDLGRLAGSAAHLSALRRASSGPFRVAEATPAMAPEAARLRPALDAMPSMSRVALEADDIERVTRGMPVSVGDSADDLQRCALVDRAGALVAIAERKAGSWRPKVVLREA